MKKNTKHLTATLIAAIVLLTGSPVAAEEMPVQDIGESASIEAPVQDIGEPATLIRVEIGEAVSVSR